MKKIIKEKYESFKEKDLKNYSKIVNAYFRRKKVFSLMALTSISCSVQNNIDTDNFKQLKPDFNLSFYDKLDTIRNQYDASISTRSFVKLFTDKNDVDYSKPVNIKMTENKMYLCFSDVQKKEFVLQFYGKLHKKKFVFYTNYKTINFPVLLLIKQMERYKIQLSENNELLIEKYNVNEGMMLCFGAGNSYENLYRFKIL